MNNGKVMFIKWISEVKVVEKSFGFLKARFSIAGDYQISKLCIHF